jgi:ubiquinone/menaquinone biosynthesis C-methylase UbiE
MAEAWWRLVRFGFRLLYNEMAFTYDLVSRFVSLGAWRSWQRTSLNHLPAPETGMILELAHGTGDLEIDLHAAGYRAIGFDLSPHMGRIAQRKLRRQKITPWLVRGKAQALPFADASFTAVVSTFPTDFFIVSETLRDVHRVLQPGGRYVIVVNGVLTGRGISRRFLEWLYRITGQRGERSADMIGLFAKYQFDAALHEEACPGSIAQVIVATRR